MNPNSKTPSLVLAEALAEEIPENRIATVLSDALSADMINRDGTRSPDHKVRLAAAQMALSYRYGLPTRREEVHVSLPATDDTIGIAERMRHSPALRESFRKMLAEAQPSIEI
jgi:hypothetical protein